MDLDLTKEQAIPISEVPQYVPKRRGKKVHYSTVYRWATKGSRGRILETSFSGGLRYTSIEAVKRFLNAESPPRQRETDDVSEAIDAALSRAGV